MSTYKPMKIGVLNLSGNVGKTTLTTHLLSAFRPDAKVVSVETANNSDALDIEGLAVEEIRASRFKDIYRELMMNDDLIIDVGASNVSTFMDELTKYRSSIGEFDMIVIPTVPDGKQQKDTVATIDWLNKLGIESDKIRVVFNQHDGSSTIAESYEFITGFAMTAGKKLACWSPQPIVSNNEIFELIKATRKTVRELANDKTDWKAERVAAKAAGDVAALEKAMDHQIAHDLATAALANLEQAYEDLMAPYVKPKK